MPAPPANPNFAGSQAWYNLAVGVDPNDDTRLIIGGIDMLISDDAGATWTQISQWYGAGFQFVHADHHTVVFRPGSSTEIIFGNDGGVWYSNNGDAATPTIQARNNGYNVTQYYAGALHPTSGSNYMLAGSQDNGSHAFNSPGIGAVNEVTGGDGGFCFIDQDNGDIQITSYIRRAFHLSTNGGASFTNNFFGNNRLALFITPAEYNDAANILYTSDSRDTLARVSDVGGANTLTRLRISQFNNDRATAIAISPTTPNRIFVGTENGEIVRINNALKQYLQEHSLMDD
jgi:hypothetical protein